MATYDIDTNSSPYTTRRTQFTEIISWWGPKLAKYFSLSEEQKLAWRSNDPFLDDILRLAEKVNRLEKEWL